MLVWLYDRMTVRLFGDCTIVWLYDSMIHDTQAAPSFHARVAWVYLHLPVANYRQVRQNDLLTS